MRVKSSVHSGPRPSAVGDSSNPARFALLGESHPPPRGEESMPLPITRTWAFLTAKIGSLPRPGLWRLSFILVIPSLRMDGAEGALPHRSSASVQQPGALSAFAGFSANIGESTQEENPKGTVQSPPFFSPPRACQASGLRPALLHCSSFRYFHSPCRVLCTFRSRYLCNIGCQSCRGIFSETPQRASGCIFQATLHMRRQQARESTHQRFQPESATSSS